MGDPPGPGSGQAQSARSRRRKPLTPSEAILVGALPLILYAAHLAFGAAQLPTALLFTAVFGLYAAVLMSFGWARRGLARVSGLLPVAVLFALTLSTLLWALTPYAPGGAHPVWAYVGVAGAAALDRSAVWLEALKLLGLTAVFVASVVLAASRRRARLLVNVLVGLSVVYALWAILAHLSDPQFVLGAAKRFHQSRLTGSFLSANSAGTFLGASLLLATCALFEPLRRETTRQSLDLAIRRMAPLALGLITLGTALLLTASRGALAATVVALALFFLAEGLRGGWRWRTSTLFLLIAAGAVLLLLLPRASEGVMQRYATIQADAVVRQDIFAAHWAAFEASPWAGYGLGSFDRINQLVITPGNYGRLWDVHALHNVYIQWLEEAGIVGASLMFAVIAMILWMIINGVRRRPDDDLPLKGAALASLVILIHGLSDYALQIPSIQAWWACTLGLGFGLARRT